MRIVVFGAGAVGSLLGALLARAHRVTLIARAPHVDAIRRHGLVVDAESGFTVPIDAQTQASAHLAPELVLLTVKAYDTEPALESLAPLMGRGTVLLTGQNGLGNWEAACRRFPGHAVLGASITLGAFLDQPGRVRWNGVGEIVVGGRPEHRGAVDAAVETCAAGGLSAKATENLLGTLWLKAIINAAINPLSAIHRVPNGRLLEDPRLRERMQRACDEAVRVATAEGVRLPSTDPWSSVERVATLTAKNRSSMLQSVERGQRTEIDAITGRILAAARRHQIPCPQNEELFAAVKALEPRLAA